MMHLKRLFLIATLLILGTYFSNAQTKINAEINTGLGFQNKISIDNQKISNNAFSTRFGANIQIPIYKKIFVETGIYGLTNSGKKEFKTHTLKHNSLHMQFPLFVGYTIKDKWQVQLGLAIQNERNFDEINVNQIENLRVSFINKVNYAYNKKVNFHFYTNWSLEDTPDVYAATFSKNSIQIGVSYTLWSHNKKEKEQNKEEKK